MRTKQQEQAAEKRQRAVELIGKGLTNRQIAERLGLSLERVSGIRREAGGPPAPTGRPGVMDCSL